MLSEYIKTIENKLDNSTTIKWKIMEINYKIDIWALGIVLFRLLVGVLPFVIYANFDNSYDLFKA